MAWKKAPTEEQKAKAEARRERFRALAKKVADMDDDERQAIVDKFGAVVTVEGRRLSDGNTLLLAEQCETVSMVGGFQQWKRAGRVVRKGEHGLMIWLPIKSKAGAGEGAEDAAAVTVTPSQDGTATIEGTTQRQRFMMGTV